MRSVTEAGDTLFEIAARLDDAALLALYPVQREQITRLVENSDWWYARSRLLVRRDLEPRSANWSKIYYALSNEMKRSDDKGYVSFQSGFDYLPSLLVLEEVYGQPRWQGGDASQAWSLISSPEVLQHLLDSGLLKATEARGISSITSRGWTSMVEPLYRLMKANVAVGREEAFFSELGRVCSLAIEAGHYDTAEEIVVLLVKNDPALLKGARSRVLASVLSRDPAKSDVFGLVGLLLLLYGDDRSQLSRALEEGIWNDEVSPDTIQVLVDMNLLDLEWLQRQLDKVISQRAWNVISFLVERGHVDSNLPWNEMLEKTIESAADSLPNRGYIEYLLTKTSAASDDNLLLRLAVYKRGYEVARTLLQDPRVDPMKDLRAILKSDSQTRSSALVTV